MCQLCNGTHVVHYFGGYHTKISTCLNCGPVPVEIQLKKSAALRVRIEAAREIALMQEVRYEPSLQSK